MNGQGRPRVSVFVPVDAYVRVVRGEGRYCANLVMEGLDVSISESVLEIVDVRKIVAPVHESESASETIQKAIDFAARELVKIRIGGCIVLDKPFTVRDGTTVRIEGDKL